MGSEGKLEGTEGMSEGSEGSGKRTRPVATNDTSIMSSNGGVGCGVGSSNSGGGDSGSVCVMLAKGSQGILEQYLSLELLICALYGGSGVNVNGIDA